MRNIREVKIMRKIRYNEKERGEKDRDEMRKIEM